MPALETIGDYVVEARRLLQDEVAAVYRYPDKDLVDAFNMSMQEIRRIRPDIFLPSYKLPFIPTTGAIAMATAVALDEMYRSTVVYYMVGRMQLRDEEDNTDARAAALLTKFTKQLLVTDA